MNQKSYTLNTIFKNLLLYFSIIALALVFSTTSSALSSGENSKWLRCIAPEHQAISQSKEVSREI